MRAKGRRVQLEVFGQKNEMARVKDRKGSKSPPWVWNSELKSGESSLSRVLGEGLALKGKNRVIARLKHNFDGGFLIWFDLILMRSLNIIKWHTTHFKNQSQCLVQSWNDDTAYLTFICRVDKNSLKYFNFYAWKRQYASICLSPLRVVGTESKVCWLSSHSVANPLGSHIHQVCLKICGAMWNFYK